MKTLIFTSIILISSVLFAQSYSVTFRVDMKEVAVLNDTVSIAGDFQVAAGFPSDWTPGTTLLTDANNDSIYECTISLPAGTYHYKFINGSAWGMDETVPAACADFGNRVTFLSQDTILALVCFSNCTSCFSRKFSVTFRVDMSEAGTIADTVCVAGDFQMDAGYAANFTPGLCILTDPDHDSIYELTVSLPEASYIYRYINGTDYIFAETVPSECQYSGNRYIQTNPDTILPAVCFGSCFPCNPTSINEIQQGFEVYISGITGENLILNMNTDISGSAYIQITDINGKLFNQLPISEKTSIINISELNSGVYIIQLITKTGTFSGKFLKL